MFKFWNIIKFLTLFAVDPESESEGGAENIDGLRYDDDGNVVGNRNDARLALLNKINDNNDGSRGDELKDVNDDGSTSDFLIQTAEGETQALVDETVENPKDEDIGEGFVKTEPSKFKIKVNGKEQELTQEELITRAQKVEAADQYLAEAARIRNEALSSNSRPSEQDVENQQQNVEEDDIALARAIQMGNEEEAVAAIRKLRAAGPSQDDLAKTVDERLTFRDAINEFRREYKDIVSNPYLNKLAIDRDIELIKAGDNRSYAERFKAIGDELREFVKHAASNAGYVDKAEDKPESIQQSKQDKKESVKNSMPKIAGSKLVTQKDDEKEETTSDIIESMAKSRGGPQWMQGAR